MSRGRFRPLRATWLLLLVALLAPAYDLLLPAGPFPPSERRTVIIERGESLRAMSARAVEAVRDVNGRLGPDATWLACTHGDVIKAIVADALGLHLDGFQHIGADPCSLTVIRYAEAGTFVVRTNDVGGSVTDLVPGPGRRRGRRP